MASTHVYSVISLVDISTEIEQSDIISRWLPTVTTYIKWILANQNLL